MFADRQFSHYAAREISATREVVPPRTFGNDAEEYTGHCKRVTWLIVRMHSSKCNQIIIVIVVSRDRDARKNISQKSGHGHALLAAMC